MKQCNTCNVYKTPEEFVREKNQCKPCRNAYVRQYKADRQSGVREKITVNVIDGKKYCVCCNILKPLTDYCARKTKHGYRHDCKDCRRLYLQDYYTNTYNEVRRDRKKNDIAYRLICNQRLYIYKCVQKFHLPKDRSSLKYLECSLSTMKKWLEFQFDEDMTWKNYGTLWTIDHILPLSRFDLENKAHQAIAFNWKNLQPLKDNFVKSNKIRQYEFWNSVISAHRFIQKEKLDQREYQGIRESICWLRDELR